MKAIEDISPWQEVEHLEKKQTSNFNTALLPKVSQISPSSLDIDFLEPF